MTTSTPRPIRPDDLFRIRFVSDPQLHPQTNRVAFVNRIADEKTNTYVSHVWVASDSGDPIQFTTGTAQDNSPRWAPDGSRMVFVSDRTKPGSQLFLIPTNGGEARQLTFLDEGLSPLRKVMFYESDFQYNLSAPRKRIQPDGS